MTIRLDHDVLSEVLQTLERFGTDNFPREERLRCDREDIFPEQTIRRMLSSDLAFHLMFVPEEYGGLGASVQDIAVFSEAMARMELGVATAFLAISLGMDPLRVGGTADQKQLWMGRIAEEGLIVAYGVTEPGAGSDLSSLKSLAEPIRDASGELTSYRLRGVKQFITNGGVADLYTILAIAPGGPSFFVVERSDAGLQSGRPEEKHGIRLSNTSQVILDDVFIPSDRLIGGIEGKGLAQAVEVFGYTRLMVAAFGLGAGKAAMGRAIRYAHERVQSGKTLLEFQGYTHRLIIPHVISLEAAKSYIMEVAGRLDSGEHGLETEGAIAKYVATESANSAAEAAMQALGGYGYTHEYEVEKIRRDVRITTIYEGTSEILLQTIAKDRWRLNLQTRGEWLEETAVECDRIESRHGELGAAVLAETARMLRRVLEQMRLARLTRQQHILFMLADMLAFWDVAVAFCRQADRLRRENEDRDGYFSAASRVFAHQTAAKCAHTSLRALIEYGPWSGEELASLRKTIRCEDLLYSGLGNAAAMDSLVPFLLDKTETW